MRRFTVPGLTLVALLLLATTAGAFTVYTDKTAWEAAISGPFLTEDFEDTTLNPGISYTGSESANISNGFFHDVLAVESANAPRTTWFFTPQITAYGGNWTLGGPGGGGSSLQVYVEDVSYVGTIVNDYNGEFWGFIADPPFTSVLLIGGSGTNQQNYKLDNMVYTMVPVPGSLWLMGAGLVGLLFRRRKTA
jgi:hypothetical protein